MEWVGLVLAALATWILIQVIRRKQRSFEDQGFSGKHDGALVTLPKLSVSKELAEVIGNGPLQRTEVVKKLWAYIRKNDLQDPKERRMINADEKLRVVFGGKARVSMFEMTTLVNAHLGAAEAQDVAQPRSPDGTEVAKPRSPE
jgi:chromatin remodeling complex protein RSC6